MNKTTHYQLNQWEASDQVKRTDFNEDNAKIDAALAGKAEAAALTALQSQVTKKAEASALTALQTMVNGKGNCNVYVGTYMGEGTSIRTLTFPAGFQPKVVIVAGFYSAVFVRGAAQTAIAGAGTSTEARASAGWGTGTVTLPGNYFNAANSTYAYAMLG